MLAKLVTYIFTSTIRTYKFNLLVTLILYLTLKLLKLLESFGLMLHEIDIPISTQVIREGKNITITTARCYTHWTTHIGMYDFQQVRSSLHHTRKWSLSHFSHQTCFASFK